MGHRRTTSATHARCYGARMVDRRRARGFQKFFNRIFVWMFRLRKGRLAFKGAPTMILHTTGRRSGQPRKTPLLYLDLGDGRAAVVASNGGDDRSPAWALNLQANPDVEADVRGGRVAYRASMATEVERAEMWPKAVAMYKAYDSYQEKTEREIPIVVLTPR